MSPDSLRKKFLDFFKSRKHKIVESDSLLPRDDPTVLFTPAGMNQFKKQFLGRVTNFRRAATAQRCLRTDDLDKVGKTSGHHTFFEMLGNFSFGDYFKEEAIVWAWEFLTGELKINKERLWVSVYKDDDEAYGIWKDKVGISPDKVLKLGDKENFWPSEAKEKGPNGPCGPCSEIFFDLGANSGCGKKDCDPSCSCGRFLEVWNLVFTQFNRKEGGVLEPLPQKNIDTGMGLERLTAIMQGAPNNFETGLFKPLIKEIAAHIKADADKNKRLIYAVSDHIRAIVFAIYDGVLPSNDGRGYVVRKLIRKSSLHLRALGITRPFLYKLAPLVAQVMKEPYPDLIGRRENIAEIILAEENGFAEILDSSDTLFEDKFREILKKPESGILGEVAFQLYDTYGIPFELTRDWLGKRGIRISEEAFNIAMGQQKERSKSQSAMKGDVFDVKDLHLGLRETKFSGYRYYEAKGKILKILKGNVETQKIDRGEEAKIVLDATPFYPESGGQVGDTGGLARGKNVFEVLDTKKLDKVIIHIGKVKEGSFKKQDFVTAKVDIQRRLSIARNHTATHILQAALRKVLGEHVRQQGSLVAPERLRFDFTHFKDIQQDQLDRIEAIVNDYVLDNLKVSVRNMSLSEAKKTGALAFFGDKYEGKVRVVSVEGISKEFCGGTHLSSTGQVGLFKVIQEGSVASGVRRIEALTGTPAYKYVREEERIIADLSTALGAPVQRLGQEVSKRLAKIKELEKQLTSRKLSDTAIDEAIRNAEVINGIKVVTSVITDLDMDTLRRTADLIKAKSNNSNTLVASATSSGDNALLVLSITPDLDAKGLDVSRLVKDIAAEIGGSGGGRKDFAQAGGNNPRNLEGAFKKLKSIIANLNL